jgi:CubicO group peptidase (beta-lactamase class C family)
MVAHGSRDARLELLAESVRQDVASGLYFGSAITISVGDDIVVDLAEGHADAAATQPISTDTVFSIFSATKAFINVLVLRAIELGQLALTTKVVEVVPEFSGPPRDRITVLHLLTHTTGIPGMWEMRPDMYLDELDDAVAAVCEKAHGSIEPGGRCDYSPMVNHVLLAELLRRTDPRGRSINDILREDLFDPLGMDDTGLGIRPHMRSRHAVPDMRGTIPVKALSRLAPGDNGLYEAEVNEATWMGAASTTGDMTAFAQMLRADGVSDGNRFLSGRMLELARVNHTGDLHNEIYRAVALRSGYTPPPAYIGLGFSLRGEAICKHQFGTLTSPQTFGNYGAGSTVFWVDPTLDMTFVGLSAGLLPQAQNIDRWQRLSDLAVGAVA